MALAVQAMDQKIMGRDAVLAKLKAANDRPPSAQASEDRQLSRMSRSIRASRKQVSARMLQAASLTALPKASTADAGQKQGPLVISLMQVLHQAVVV